MNSLPEDQNFREFYETFSTNHDQHRDAVIHLISSEPSSQVPSRTAPSVPMRQRSRRSLLVGLMALILLGFTLPYLTNGFETKPATVLEDGWRREFVVESDKSSIEIEDQHRSMLELWTEDGWLIACRKSAVGDVEWQVVLAKTKVAEEPKVVQTPDDLTVTFGAYSIHDAASGELRIRRQLKKSDDQWPLLKLAIGKTMLTGNCWNVYLSSQRIDNWVWIVGGPSDWKKAHRNDLWLRLEQSKNITPPFGTSSGLFSIEFSFPPRKVTDDGKQFIANRTMNAELAKTSEEL